MVEEHTDGLLSFPSGSELLENETSLVNSESIEQQDDFSDIPNHTHKELIATNEEILFDSLKELDEEEHLEALTKIVIEKRQKDSTKSLLDYAQKIARGVDWNDFFEDEDDDDTKNETIKESENIKVTTAIVQRLLGHVGRAYGLCIDDKKCLIERLHKQEKQEMDPIDMAAYLYPGFEKRTEKEQGKKLSGAERTDLIAKISILMILMQNQLPKVDKLIEKDVFLPLLMEGKTYSQVITKTLQQTRSLVIKNNGLGYNHRVESLIDFFEEAYEGLGYSPEFLGDSTVADWSKRILSKTGEEKPLQLVIYEKWFWMLQNQFTKMKKSDTPVTQEVFYSMYVFLTKIFTEKHTILIDDDVGTYLVSTGDLEIPYFENILEYPLSQDKIDDLLLYLLKNFKKQSTISPKSRFFNSKDHILREIYKMGFTHGAIAPQELYRLGISIDTLLKLGIDCKERDISSPFGDITSLGKVNNGIISASNKYGEGLMNEYGSRIIEVNESSNITHQDGHCCVEKAGNYYLVSKGGKELEFIIQGGAVDVTFVKDGYFCFRKHGGSHLEFFLYTKKEGKLILIDSYKAGNGFKKFWTDGGYESLGGGIVHRIDKKGDSILLNREGKKKKLGKGLFASGNESLSSGEVVKDGLLKIKIGYQIDGLIEKETYINAASFKEIEAHRVSRYRMMEYQINSHYKSNDDKIVGKGRPVFVVRGGVPRDTYIKCIDCDGYEIWGTTDVETMHLQIDEKTKERIGFYGKTTTGTYFNTLNSKEKIIHYPDKSIEYIGDGIFKLSGYPGNGPSLINKTGKKIMPLLGDLVSHFIYGIAQVKENFCTAYFINTSGEKLFGGRLKIDTDEFDCGLKETSEEGGIIVINRANGLQGHANYKGEIVIPPIYSTIRIVKEGNIVSFFCLDKEKRDSIKRYNFTFDELTALE